MKIGERAPEFSVRDHNGEEVSLAAHRGRKVALFFYPKDMTPGCTLQVNDLNDNLDRLREEGYDVIGVSADSADRHCKFQKKYDLAFPLIPDTEKELIQAYGVWGKKKFMGREFMGIKRTTFIIDEEGMIARIIDKVKTRSHSMQILNEN